MKKNKGNRKRGERRRAKPPKDGLADHKQFTVGDDPLLRRLREVHGWEARHGAPGARAA